MRSDDDLCGEAFDGNLSDIELSFVLCAEVIVIRRLFQQSLGLGSGLVLGQEISEASKSWLILMASSCMEFKIEVRSKLSTTTPMNRFTYQMYNPLATYLQKKENESCHQEEIAEDVSQNKEYSDPRIGVSDWRVVHRVRIHSLVHDMNPTIADTDKVEID